MTLERGKKMKKFVLIIMVVCLTIFMSSIGFALDGDYPNHPVTWIVPFGVAGANGTSARMLAEYMENVIGQPINIVHKSGASGTIGMRAFLMEKQDGYTIACLSSAAVNAPVFQATEQFDMDKFKYIGSYMSQQRVIFTHLNTPYKTWQEFLNYIKAHPGEVTVGAGGGQWSIETIKSIAVKVGLDLDYVTFKSGGDAAAAVLGGHIDVTDSGVGSATYIAAVAGELRLLLVLGNDHLDDFPEIPIVKDLGYPFVCTREYGFLLHAGISEEIRQFWENALRKTLEMPELINKMRGVGFKPRFLPGEEYEKLARYAATSVIELKEYNKALE